MSIEAMKQALEALEYADEMIDTACVPKAITNLRIAIEQAEKIEPVMGTKTWYEDGKVITQNLYPSDVYKQEKQEPFGWVSQHTVKGPYEWQFNKELSGVYRDNAISILPVYTTPQLKREWVGLTDEERNHARQTITYSQLAMTAGEWTEAVQIETEKRLKEKNNG